MMLLGHSYTIKKISIKVGFDMPWVVIRFWPTSLRRKYRFRGKVRKTTRRTIMNYISMVLEPRTGKLSRGVN